MAPRTLVVGDSLGVGTVPYLRKMLGGKVDADVKVGRSSADGVNALQRRGTYDRVVLDLGTNDGTADQLRASVRRARTLAHGAAIFVATVHGPDAARKNAMLRNLNGVTLVDWAGKSGGMLAGDGIHATPKGYEARARLLAGAMRGSGGAAASPAPPAVAAAPSSSARQQAALALLSQAPIPSMETRDANAYRAAAKTAPLDPLKVFQRRTGRP